MAVTLDTGYAKSCYGILKVLEFLCLLVAFVCMLDVTSTRFFREKFFLGVTITAWLFVIIWFCLYFFMLCGKFSFGNQGLIFGIIHLIWGGLLVVAGALVADKAAGWSKWACQFARCEVYEAAAAFCLVSALLFFIDGIYHIYQHTNGVTRVHGGARTVTTTRTVVKTTKTTK